MIDGLTDIIELGQTLLNILAFQNLIAYIRSVKIHFSVCLCADSGLAISLALICL